MFLGLTLHSSELNEINEAHKKTCIGYENRIRELKSKLNELKETEGNNNAGKDIYRNSSADWW